MARTIARRCGKALLGLVLVLALLAGVGAVYQAVATGRAQRAQPAPGVLVDVAGHRLHLACVGEGSPTVVLDAALGNMSAHWALVQQEVARTTRVCTYDRAGLGWSEPGPGPRDAAHITSELHTLLANAGIPGPYVMVGHSFGGLYTQLFAARYADQVAAVVLVESSTRSSSPGRRTGSSTTNRPGGCTPSPRSWHGWAWCGCSTSRTATGSAGRAARADRRVGRLDPTHRRHSRRVRRRPGHHRAGGRGPTAWVTCPLAVVTAGEQDPAWLALQIELAALSTNSSHHVVDGATHTSVVDDPGHAPVGAQRRHRPGRRRRTKQLPARALAPPPPTPSATQLLRRMAMNSTAPDRASVRISATLLFVGQLLYIAITQMHAGGGCQQPSGHLRRIRQKRDLDVLLPTSASSRPQRSCWPGLVALSSALDGRLARRDGQLDSVPPRRPWR